MVDAAHWYTKIKMPILLLLWMYFFSADQSVYLAGKHLCEGKQGTKSEVGHNLFLHLKPAFREVCCVYLAGKHLLYGKPRLGEPTST